MKKLIFTSILIAIILTSCTNDVDPFSIAPNNIGLLTDSTQVKDLESIFSKDSISKYVAGNDFTGNINDIEIYESGGQKLLVLTATRALDSTATIKHITVVDPRFKTEKGLHINSTFKDIKDNYKVSNIQNTLKTIIVSLNEINAYVTIDKTELPADMRFNMDLKIEAIQIPDEAKLKGLFLQWY